jgi:hypothetical protein
MKLPLTQSVPPRRGKGKSNPTTPTRGLGPGAEGIEGETELDVPCHHRREAGSASEPKGLARM